MANLRHTLALFDDSKPEDFVVIATSNIYGRRVRTGLTWRDLLLLDEMAFRIEGLEK